jgi:hypothetical protein
VKDLYKTYSPEYKVLSAERWQKLQENPNCYEIYKTHQPDRTIIDGSMTIIHPYVYDRSGEERYFLRFFYKIADLKNDTPLKTLALDLNTIIRELGFFCTDVDVRLEKGCENSLAQHWHLDGYPVSITICWSSITKWRTYVLDEVNTKKFSIHHLPLMPVDERNETTKKIEAFGQASKFGHFYNASKVMHRGPTAEDLSEEKIGVDDYRLFFRFTKPTF